MTEPENGSRHRILIIDDDQLTSMALMKTLKDDSVSIFAVADGSNALSEIRSIPYALVFLEVAIADGTGMIVLQEISRSSPSTCIVVMSAGIPNGEAEDMIMQYDHFFLPKPFEILQVRTMTRRILADASRARQVSVSEEHVRKQKRGSVREPRSDRVSIISDPAASYPGIPQSLHGTMVDVSAGGLGVRTDLPLPPGQRFSFQDDTSSNEGIVRWSMVAENHFRAGIQFIEN